MTSERSWPGEAARQLYTEHLRQRIAEGLFERLGVPLVTRRAGVDDVPPSFVERREFFDSEKFTIDPPLTVGPVPDELRQKARQWELDRPFVLTLRDVDLVGPNALPVTAAGAFVVEATDGSTLRVTDALVRAVGNGHLPCYRGTGEVHDCLVSFAGPWSTEFFHWFADYLPRLRVLRQYETCTGVEPRLLVPSDPPAWLTDSLDRLGVDPNRRVRWSGGRWSVNQLVVPSLPRHAHPTFPPEGYVHSPRELGWAVNQLLDGVSASDRPDVGRRLYVSRAHQPTRHVRNEADLLSVAGEFGFETVYPERWSLAEQLAAFAEADAVLGPHGAGLFNAVYADNAVLIELFGERTNPCFFSIAEGMNIPYAMTRCRVVGSDLAVDPDDLRELLTLALDG